jgi:hypothetical protein
MKSFSFIMVLPLIVASNITLAMSSDIQLNGGAVIAPQQKLQLSFLNSGLKQGVRYNVSCAISNPNYDDVKVLFAVIENYPVKFNARIDDMPLSSNYTAEIAPGRHTYQVDGVGLLADVMNIAQLEFTNLDFANSITVTNCFATPAIL